MVSVSPENVATPLVAVTVSVPPSVAPPGLFASATVTVPLKEDLDVARAIVDLNRQAESRARGETGGRLLRHHQLPGDRWVAQEPERLDADSRGVEGANRKGAGDFAVWPHRDAFRIVTAAQRILSCPPVPNEGSRVPPGSNRST